MRPHFNLTLTSNETDAKSNSGSDGQFHQAHQTQALRRACREEIERYRHFQTPSAKHSQTSPQGAEIFRSVSSRESERRQPSARPAARMTAHEEIYFLRSGLPPRLDPVSPIADAAGD